MVAQSETKLYRGSLQILRYCLRTLGAIVCLIFAIHGINLLRQPDIKDFWTFSSYASDGMQGILAGCLGVYLEVKGKTHKKHFMKFVLNRFVTASFYFWLGFHLFGDSGKHISSPLWWICILRATAISSWLLFAGNVILAAATSLEKEDESPEVSIRDVEQGRASTASSESDPAAGNKDLAPEGGWNASMEPKVDIVPPGGWNSLA
eukprot:TRINITY_DN50109_c0_g1_i1.p1 TRINITY_DN50109_c0_g1~~TRINITY_DN50109_c0_g1_i1.p1  ORF type:complete len:206 (+),score=49.26 TRINITY_DN50109_c0_g1_i1:43-660(+)